MKYSVTKKVGRRSECVRTPNGTRYFMFVGKLIHIDPESAGADTMKAKMRADIDWFNSQPEKFTVSEGFSSPAGLVVNQEADSEPESEPEPDPEEIEKTVAGKKSPKIKESLKSKILGGVKHGF